MKKKYQQFFKATLMPLFVSISCLMPILATNQTVMNDVLDKTVSLNLQNVTLSDALLQLERSAEVQFVYSSKNIQAQRKVSIVADQKKLATVLDAALKPLQIRYKLVSGQIVLQTVLPSVEVTPLSMNLSLSVDKMVQTITGKVKDKNGEAIIGMSVSIKGTTKGTLTDADGNFSLNANVGDVLVFSFIGYTTQEVAVTATTSNLDIVLEEAAGLISEVTVVGSRFGTKPRTNVDRPVPIDVINVKDLQATGQVDLGQSIHYSAPSFNAVKFGINDGAPFVDPATLRGLGPDQVLVTVNNKRRHKVSFLSINDGVGKGQVGTDINVVPALSLKRVEVLRDGAAAQYGSDAIAGVINLQLNNASSGGTVNVYTGTGYSRPQIDVNNLLPINTIVDGKTYSVAANIGLKLGSKGFVNGTLTYSHTAGYDRSGSYKASAGFYVKDAVKDDSLVKANNINLDRAFLGAAENTTMGIFINAGIPINEKWDFYTFGGYTNKKVITGIFTRPPSNTKRSVLSIFPNGYNPIAPATLTDYSITAGVKGELAGWKTDLSVGQGSNQVDWNVENTVNASFGAASPTKFYVGTTHVTQTLVNADITKSFNTKSYPNLTLGFGTEFRGESFEQIAGDTFSWKPGPLFKTTDIGSSGREGFSDKTAGKWNRTNIGVYADVESELSKALLVGAAIRGENYSDFGSDISAKINARYKATDAFAIRGSISRGFRAPSMTQIHYSNYANISFDNLGNSLYNPVLPVDYKDAPLLGINGLKKETSWDFAGGITSKFGDYFTMTADLYQIDVDNRISLSAPIPVSTYPEFVAAGFPSTAQFFVNALDTRTNGFEFVANYNRPIDKDHKVAINAAYSSMTTVLRANRTTDKGIQVVNADAALYITDGQPRNKLIVSANYDYKQFGILLRATRFGEVSDALATLKVAPTDVTAKKYQVFSAKTLFDVAIIYRPLKKLTITVGANNFTDVYPDLLQVPQQTNEVVYSRRTNQFGTQGRFLNMSVNYSF
jgi:iron complex outermembrane recepter protein